MIFELFTICIIFSYLQVERIVYVENAWIFGVLPVRSRWIKDVITNPTTVLISEDFVVIIYPQSGELLMKFA